jgi:hypothetical protein
MKKCTRAQIQLLSLFCVGLLLSRRVYALQEGDYTYTVESGKATITAFSKNGTSGESVGDG